MNSHVENENENEKVIFKSDKKIVQLNSPSPLFSNQSGTIADPKYEWFTVDFDSTAVKSLHWDAPSALHVMVNGDVYVNVAHLANMRRTWVGDGGKVFVARVLIELYEEKDSQPYEFTFPVKSLNYKEEAFNFETRYHYPSLENVVTKYHYIGATQEWVEGKQLPDPTPIPIPPIKFP